MTRTQFQPGPARDHYHDGLGVDSTAGSGVSVDNGTDPPAAVTTLVAPGAIVSTPGQADLPHGLPAQWTVDAHGDAALAPDSDTAGTLIKITAPAGFIDNSPDARMLSLVGEDGTIVGALLAYGDLELRAPAGQSSFAISLDCDTWGPTEGASLNSNGIEFHNDDNAFPGTNPTIIVSRAGTPTRKYLSFVNSLGQPLFEVGKDGSVRILVHVAPDDGDLVAGELALWFDETDGAAKLMLKGKTANGTVRTGSVSLT